MPTIRLRYAAEVRDKHGILMDREEGDSKSLVRAFGAMLKGILSGVNEAAVKNKANVDKTLNVSALVAGTAQVAMGTNATAVTMSQYALIAEDSAADATITLQVDTAAEFKLAAWKSLPSAAGLTVREIGLYVKLTDTGPGSGYFLAARDVVTDKVVPPLGSLTVQYVFDLLP